MTKPPKDKPVSIFARPLESHRPASAGPLTGLSAFQPSSGLALAALLAITCVAFLLQTRQNGAQDLTATQKTMQKKKSGAHVKPVRVALAERGKGAENSAETARPALDYYTRGVRGTMFSAPTPPTPKEQPAPRPPKIVLPKINPQFVNPFMDWTYAGTVTAGDKKMALLENRTSKEGQYVREGQTFMGATVKNVTDQMVTLVSAGKPYPLAKSDTINVTPLSASAAYLTQPQQQAQQAGQPANAQAMMAVPAGGVGMVLPNGTVLDANRAARFNNRMNNRFNGGGGQGGGRGNRGGRGGGGFGNGQGGGGQGGGGRGGGGMAGGG